MIIMEAAHYVHERAAADTAAAADHRHPPVRVKNPFGPQQGEVHLKEQEVKFDKVCARVCFGGTGMRPYVGFGPF